MLETPFPSSPQDNAWTISTKVWLDDGNVVLQAEDTLFRVLRSILRRESVVFRDMFSVPQPAGGEGERYDGCPIVRVQDRAEDMALFLSALFDANALDNGCDLRSHITLLDLSSKYQAFPLLRRVMTILTHHFPNTLPGHEHLEREERNGAYSCPAVTRSCRPHISTSDIYLLISVAQRRNVRVLLPSAYLRLTTVELDELLQGRAAGTLSENHLRLVVLGQRALHGLARDKVFAPLLDPSQRGTLCASTERCSKICRTICRTTVECPSTNGAVPSVFEPLDFEEAPSKELCAACKAISMTYYIVGRQYAWKELPAVFGLPPWKELWSAMQVNMQLKDKTGSVTEGALAPVLDSTGAESLRSSDTPDIKSLKSLDDESVKSLAVSTRSFAESVKSLAESVKSLAESVKSFAESVKSSLGPSVRSADGESVRSTGGESIKSLNSEWSYTRTA